MSRRNVTRFCAIFCIGMIGLAIGTQMSASARPQTISAHSQREVRHELVTLPYYGVFDWLQYEVHPDNTVVLRGQVVRPSTKSDAEARVCEIEGVNKVVNDIQTLPLSSS